MDIRALTDPGEFGTKTSLNFLEGGSGALNGVKVNTSVYANGVHISGVYEKRWNTPGFGVQRNLNHPSTAGRTFQMEYLLAVDLPEGGTTYASWKSAVTSPCEEPAPGAYRCLFPAG